MNIRASEDRWRYTARSITKQVRSNTADIPTHLAFPLNPCVEDGGVFGLRIDRGPPDFTSRLGSGDRCARSFDRCGSVARCDACRFHRRLAEQPQPLAAHHLAPG